MQCKHTGKLPHVSLSLSLGVAGHQRNATTKMMENGPNVRTAAVDSSEK